MTRRTSQASRKGKPSASKRSPKKPARQDPTSALLASLDDTFTEAERRQILAGALLALDQPARARLCDQLGATGLSLAPLLGLPTTTRRSVPTTAASQQRLDQDWQALWKEWDRIIKETDDEDGRYLQNEISYNTPDLDVDTLVADLDKVAKKLLPLLPSHFASTTAGSFDLARKLSTSLGKVAASHASYVILPDDVVSLGPALSKLALAWLWGAPTCQTPTARLSKLGKLAAALFESEPSFALDEKTLAAFVGSLGAKERKDLGQWLEKNREKEPWQEAFDDDWGPCAPLVALLRADE